ncbi:hypothetical protein KUL42_15940 [Alteromonas sp. KUL42]|uniref:hypothetical protein n=1 Tax=Alteromonas sp. KUL42 TaxID=2480797 RepID=UPI00103594BB|nr:hypothetical protein [Alteromonas sp. KUL42]TAP36621.1 hypothetical protein EYR97_07875 [Alteromonas sp. KUL42]GEA06833.1 hypothetical protein KUL42_15940 [Alteromonas sp. KUL42]
MNKKIASFFIISLSICHVANANVSESETQIREVVEKFRVSIINKDKAVFESLFYSESIPFIAVFSEEMLKAKREERADYPATVDFGKFGPPSKMLLGNDALEEKIWNVNVQTDGYLASVHFDYSDHENGKMRAKGTESWSMVKHGEDWKITSISFTVTQVNQ